MNNVVYNDCYGNFGLSKEAISWLKQYYPDFFKDMPMKRHDHRLVECVETLGLKANLKYSDLAIKEIKGDVYRIEEYDGKETVLEPDDLDWIIIIPNE